MKIIVTIEEHISQAFEVEADNLEKAIQIVEYKYYNNGFMLENACLTDRLIMASDGNNQTEWRKF